MLPSPALKLPPRGGQFDRHPGVHPRAPRQWACQVRHPATGAQQAGWIHHLSARGVSFFVENPESVEEAVEVLLLNVQATYALCQRLTILRCDRLAGGQWYVAGTFPEPLRPEEIRPFLL